MHEQYNISMPIRRTYETTILDSSTTILDSSNLGFEHLENGIESKFGFRSPSARILKSQ